MILFLVRLAKLNGCLLMIFLASCSNQGTHSYSKLLAISSNSGTTTTSLNPSFTAEFSNEVQNVNVSDFVITVLSGSINPTITGITTSNSIHYTINVSLTGTGTFRVDFNDTDSSIRSNNGINLYASKLTGSSLLVTTAVTPVVNHVVSITRYYPAVNPTSDDFVEFKVLFTDIAEKPTVNDFLPKIVSGTGLSPLISGIYGAGNEWIVRIYVSGINGDISLEFDDHDGSVLDNSNLPITPSYHSPDELWTRIGL